MRPTCAFREVPQRPCGGRGRLPRKRREQNPVVHPSSGLQPPTRRDGNGRARAAALSAGARVLPGDQSAALRNQLLGDIVSLRSPDSATDWAKAAMSAKNRLTAEDAKLVADAFEQRLSTWSATEDPSRQAALPFEESSNVQSGERGADLDSNRTSA